MKRSNRLYTDQITNEKKTEIEQLLKEPLVTGVGDFVRCAWLRVNCKGGEPNGTHPTSCNSYRRRGETGQLLYHGVRTEDCSGNRHRNLPVGWAHQPGHHTHRA